MKFMNKSIFRIIKIRKDTQVIYLINKYKRNVIQKYIIHHYINLSINMIFFYIFIYNLW